MLVRPELPQDQAATRRLVGAAFSGEAVDELLDDMRESPAWLGLSYVAEVDGSVVGHVSFTRGWVDSPERLLDVLVLGPLSVRPDLQGAGVGTVLVKRALTMLEGRDEPLVFLEGSPAYYPRFGFVPGGTLGFTRPSERIPEAAFQLLTLPPYEPWMKGALVYPDVFWRHDAVGLRGPGPGE